VLGIPFILAGTLKAIYDGSLWLLFRRVPVKEATAQHSELRETGAGEGENNL
jgi:hypothetical protein